MHAGVSACMHMAACMCWIIIMVYMSSAFWLCNYVLPHAWPGHDARLHAWLCVLPHAWVVIHACWRTPACWVMMRAGVRLPVGS